MAGGGAGEPEDDTGEHAGKQPGDDENQSGGCNPGLDDAVGYEPAWWGAQVVPVGKLVPGCGDVAVEPKAESGSTQNQQQSKITRTFSSYTSLLCENGLL
jgi:hypothetical protein